MTIKYLLPVLLLQICWSLPAQDTIWSGPNHLRWQPFRTFSRELNLEYGRATTPRSEWVLIFNAFTRQAFARTPDSTDYLENKVTELLASGPATVRERFNEGAPLTDYYGFRPRWGAQLGAGWRYCLAQDHYWLHLWVQPSVTLNYHRGVEVTDRFTALSEVVSTCCGTEPDREISQTYWRQNRTYGSATNRWTGTGLALVGVSGSLNSHVYLEMRGGYAQNQGSRQPDGLLSLRRGYLLARVSLGFNW